MVTILPPRARLTLTVIFLLLLPGAVYWNTIVHRYGFRDDYSILRETHEEPGKVIRVGASQARPIFGFLLQHSFARLERVDDFRWMRLLSAGLLGALAVLLFAVLRAQRWDEDFAAAVAALVTLLPGAQVVVSWAVSWPPVLALVLAAASYGCAEKSFRTTLAPPRFGWWITGLALLVLSALTYQANSLFYVVPLAAALYGRLERPFRETGGWLLRHFVTLASGPAIALAIMMTAFASGAVEMSPRVALADDVGETLAWFVHSPLPNALALFALEGTEAMAARHAVAVMAVTAILIIGMICVWLDHGWRRGMLALATLLFLPLVAYGVILFSTERVATYRTLIPLTGVILVLFTASLRKFAGRRITAAILAALALVAAWAARGQPFDFIARPQAIELALIEAGATRVNLTKHARIFIITPTLAEAPVSIRLADEFGSLSTDSDWVPKEMLATALQRFFGNVQGRYTCECGRTLPANRNYDVVIDLGRLREFQPKESRRGFNADPEPGPEKDTLRFHDAEPQKGTDGRREPPAAAAEASSRYPGWSSR